MAALGETWVSGEWAGAGEKDGLMTYGRTGEGEGCFGGICTIYIGYGCRNYDQRRV